MSDRHQIVIVEDNAPQRRLLARLLAANYAVTDFSSGEAFLAASPLADVVLLDIEMPGINGYETCRRMREQEPYADAPVIFVSAHDSAEDRVHAYEAGGDHFLTKPIVAGELNHKIESVLTHRDALRDLKSQSSWAQQVAFSAMSGMGDLGVIIEFFRKSPTCKDYQSLAQAVIEAISTWGLRGIVQIRGLDGEVNLGSDALISPLQASVMATMRSMGRIFELKSRAVVNFEHVSILVHNLPTDDADKVGRLRDNLALLGEGADFAIANLDANNSRQQELQFLAGSVNKLTEMMQKVAVNDATNRNAIHKLAMEVLDGLAHSFGGLGLTDIQRDYIGNLVHDGIDELTLAFDEAATIQRDFTDILIGLQNLARGQHSPDKPS